MIQRLSLLLLMYLPGTIMVAQELNCTVTVLTPQIQSSDKKIYTTLQTAIYEFMNNMRWTDDQFENRERIECSMQITINERVSNDEFKGTIQIQSRRPVYKTSYFSPMLSVNDENFHIRYIEFQTIELNETGTNPALAAILAYYAYIIIGMDYDSFSPLGGSPLYQKAQTIVSNQQNSPERGWRAFESTRNRYWLAENLNNPVFRPVRDLYYQYHRRGLDIMTEKKEDAITAITETMSGLQVVHDDKPGSYLMQLLLYAKSDELVNILGGAFPEVKVRMVNLLNELDPANGSKYQSILNRN